MLKNAGFAGFFEGYNPFTITDNELAEKICRFACSCVSIRLGLGSGASDAGGWAWIWAFVFTVILIVLLVR